ncbi:hypothetical protein C8J56DRAFT_381939 [Mycena floridula]|nr:hypothetical protein C8J56DRAFT_381939 [Mycena floridula]
MTSGSDERSSQSGSDDGSSYTTMYSDSVKAELDLEESNTSLTSQTLNADGTPKRPMNAFMIFARRRRPQVSAENQSMRTGEISKILSKEWNAMMTVEKQFYLDQAKQLKEAFNSKYPDYVYRRRPNNSRKQRRRGDVGMIRNLDAASDNGEDLAALHDLSESSPDLDEPHPPNDTSHNYSSVQARPSSFSYSSSSDMSYRQQNRLSYPDRLSASLSPRIHSTQQTSYPFMHNHASQPSSSYSTDPSENAWDARIDHTRSNMPSSWLERSTISTALGAPKYPSSTSTSWPTSSGSSSTAQTSSHYAFQNLVGSSFFPPNQTQPAFAASSYSTNMSPPQRPYDHYSPSMSSQLSSGSRESYPQRHSFSGTATPGSNIDGMPRALPPPVSSLSAFATLVAPLHAQSTNDPISQIGNYWARENLEGH